MQNGKVARVADAISRTFGRVVRSNREERGFSQEELATLAGIHRTYVSSIELGKVRLGLEIAKKVADGLGVSLSDLVAQAERAGSRRADGTGRR